MIKCCNHTHAGDDAQAKGSPLRPTRKQARQDMCQWRQNKNRLEN